MKRYNPKDIEPKWQAIWQETGLYTSDLTNSKPKYMAMSMFNYPSGAGIHVGHAMNYTISDVKARFMRQKGYESYHPVGWDSFGLPAENYAIKAGVSPQESMAKIIPDYHRQYRAMGWSNDWEKEITTSVPEYYRWTQWIFIKMHEHGLAYQDSRWQWWCTKCQTVLANEQVIDGKCWRHDGKDDPLVEKKEVKQWFFKITEYADELLEATDALDWTPSVKLAQKNWIGKSLGAEITFAVKDSTQVITAFSTRADTLFGVTFMVLAPDHEVVKSITHPDKMSEVDEYIKVTAKKTEVERASNKQKTGVFTGSYAINPINNEELPIYIADYVLSTYGTGAIMAVPAHDERDREFADKFKLPIRPVVAHEYIDELTPPRQQVAFVPRDVVQCIVMHPTEDKYLLIEKLGWETKSYSFVTGGIESNDSAEETATREIEEETGYTNVVSAEVVGLPYFTQFYHEQKQVNRRAKVVTVAVKLRDLQQKVVAPEEKDLHGINWVSADDMIRQLHGEGCVVSFEAFLKNELPASPSEGVMINSDQYDGISSAAAREKIVADLVKKDVGIEKTNYRMRDWSISRQRYWGAPIPVVNCPECGPVVLGEKDLPVLLPELTDFAPSGDGHSALSRATDWLQTTCPKCDGPAERETDTMDTYVCSSWYMLRYLDPHNQEKIFESSLADKWLPVDFYNGADHATAHLLYARFVTRFFNKIGLIKHAEPFKQMLYNGKVITKDGSAFSKTLGNGPDPLEIIEQGYGADALRTYLMFAAPLELGARWDPQGVPGAHRFLSRLWNITQEYLELPQVELTADEAKKLLLVTNKAVKKVTDDLVGNRYNTAIATCMEALNGLYLLKTSMTFGQSADWQQALESLIMCIAPFAPHMTDELWQQLGHSDSVNKDHWPEWDEQYLVGDNMTVVVQVNGKVRAELSVPIDTSKEDILVAAKADAHVQEFTLNKKIAREIYVPGKIVNLVVTG